MITIRLRTKFHLSKLNGALVTATKPQAKKILVRLP
jgi:hypothetical protein